MGRNWAKFTVWLIAGILAGSLVPEPIAAETRHGIVADSAAALGRFNGAMRSLYAESRAALATAERPLIIVGLDTLTLYRADGAEEVKAYTPALYHQLKGFGHVVLGLVAALVPGAPDWPDRLRFVRREIAALRPHVGGFGFQEGQAARQLRMLDAAAAFIAVALTAGEVDPSARADVMQTLRPLLMANSREAAIAQLDGLHAAVTAWRETLATEEWARLRVLIPGPRMPRVHNLQTAYFLRLLGEPAEGGRVIYTENIYATDAVLNQLGVLLIDRQLSEWVFGTRHRMDVDLLGHVAGDYLDTLLP